MMERKWLPLSQFQPPEHDLLMDCGDCDVRGLYFYPDKRLNHPSEVVPDDFDQGELNKLIGDMAMTMYSLGGVGLSAIQVGVPLRIFICDILWIQPQKGKPPSQLLVAVNPEFGWKSEEKLNFGEGCLSFPGVVENISRPKEVGIVGKNRMGKPFALKAGGILGRVIQHEMDHLDGVVFTERMGEFQKGSAMKKMTKFHRGIKDGSIRVKDRV